LGLYNVNQIIYAKPEYHEVMKKAIAVAAMAAVVVIAGITGASSAAHAVVFFTPIGTAVMSSFMPLVSGFFHQDAFLSKLKEKLVTVK
jgi:hypothetical protein